MSDVTKQIEIATRPKRVQSPASNVGKGRKKGARNKFTTSIKAAIIEVFDRRGGVEGMLRWANKNPGAFYKLVGRLVPHEITGGDGGPLTIRIVRDSTE